MGFIRDCIHGDLHLTDYELEIVDTCEMQRLRRIKQLGFTNLIYPGANHTRFEHSIGTLFLADKLSNILELNEELIELLRVSALVHDIGHAPFSHVSERVLKHRHEDITKEIIKKSSISDIIKEKFTPQELINLIEGKKPYGKIISGDIDVDRMDYLKRDSYYTGVAYGVIDTERLMYTLKLYNNNIVLTQKGVQAAESTLLARYFMYPSVYQHHTTRIVNGMFRICLKSLLDASYVQEKDLKKIDENELIHIARHSKGISKEIIRNIDTRHLYKKIDTINLSEQEHPEKVFDITKKMINDAEEDISKKLDIKTEQVIIDIPESLSYKEMTTQVKTNEGLKPLNEVSTIVQALKKAQYNYTDLALYISPESKTKAKNIKIEDYLEIPK